MDGGHRKSRRDALRTLAAGAALPPIHWDGEIGA